MDKWLKVLIIAFAVACIAFALITYIKYGGKPITEIPSWAVGFFVK